MATLKTDFKDDILDLNQNDRRCFAMTTNEDGTVSFRDVTKYERQGDSFGATQINATNTQVNTNTSAIANNKSSINTVKNHLTASDDLEFDFNKSGNEYGFKDLDGNFKPFMKSDLLTYDSTTKTLTINLD